MHPYRAGWKVPYSCTAFPEHSRLQVTRHDALNLIHGSNPISPPPLPSLSTGRFDLVLNPKVNQVETFNAVAKSVVEDVFLGYNGAIMCCGQTGTGKTHTVSSM